MLVVIIIIVQDDLYQSAFHQNKVLCYLAMQLYNFFTLFLYLLPKLTLLWKEKFSSCVSNPKLEALQLILTKCPYYNTWFCKGSYYLRYA